MKPSQIIVSPADHERIVKLSEYEKEDVRMENKILNEELKKDAVEVSLGESKPAPPVDEKLKAAVEGMRAKLRLEKKNTLIEQWIGMYATLIKQDKHIFDLNERIKQLSTISSDVVTEGEK